MRASRLVALLLLLQARREATADALATELEVSVRTIYRDVVALQSAGVPLWTEAGPGGGIRLLDGWTGRLDGIALDEAGALFLAGTVAQASVLSTLPRELAARAGRIRQRFHVDAPDWFSRDEPVPHLDAVADAVWTGRRLDLRYGDAERRVDPLGLVLKAGRWYLVAAHRGQPRTYRVGRITAAEVRDDRAERPEGFVLADWWAASAADFDRAIRRTEVRLRVSPRGLRWLPGAVLLSELPTPGPPDHEGWVEVIVPVESDEVAAHQLLSLAGEVEVLAPLAVRAALAEAGTALLASNR
ncbi:MAG: Helix-turn-helix type 11 domain protein [Actinomycetia bacterium]|nr:Helix-turn-helix type 11 domain protein [Actinomycetes bacterium]